MNVNLLHIWDGFGDIRQIFWCIFKYKTPNIQYSNNNISLLCYEYIQYSYSLKIYIMNIFVFVFGPDFDICVTLV